MTHEMLTGIGEALENPISYYLLTDVAGKGEETYGLMVRYRDEQICVRDVTARRGDMIQLLSALLRGAVTPVTVRDVIDDWLLA